MQKLDALALIAVRLCIGLAVPSIAIAETATLNAAGDGTYHDFSTSSGTAHYTLLSSNCSAAKYTYAMTSAAADSYRLNIFLIPLGATITAIEITPCAASFNGESAVLQAIYLANGVPSATADRYDLSAGSPVTLAPTVFSGLSILRVGSLTLEAGVRLIGGTGGVKLSGLSARVTYTAPPPFLAPSNLTATSLASTEIGLNWADNSTGETGFRIERSLNGTNSWALVTVGPSNVRSYRDTRLTPDQNYYYRVKALNTTTGQQTEFSGTANAITYATPPVAPRSLWIAQSATSTTLNWTRLSNNDDGTAIERGTNGVQFQEIGRAAAGATTFSDPSGASGPVYYRVRAFNPKGNSAYSNTASNVQTSTNGPDLRVSLQASETAAGGKQTTFFTVNYANAGNVSSQNAYLTATVPAGTTFDMASSSPQWQCLNPNADAFKLATDIGRALRTLKFHFPNLQQVFISSHHYNGYNSTLGVVEPFGFETGFAAKWALEAQVDQVRSGRINPLTDDLDYRTGVAPWATWGPYLWANGATPNGQGTFSNISEFGSDLVHPNAAGAAKFGKLLLNYALSAPYTAWLRNQSEAVLPILPVPLPKPNPTAIIDMPPGQLYLGLPGGLYAGESNTIPDDHLAAGMAAAARIRPLDAAGQPSPTGQVLFLSAGYSNTNIIFNGFIDQAKVDSRIKAQSFTGRDIRSTFRILNGAIGGADTTAWANPEHDVYNIVSGLITGWGYSKNQVQAIWFNAAHGANLSFASSLSATAAATVCTQPLNTLPANAGGSTTFAVRSSFTSAQAVSFAVTALDDGTAGVDLSPLDNTAQATFIVLP
jgi:uncharacterized repeat protein (TIGR01451 family)